MENDFFSNESPKKGLDFYLVLGALAVFSLMGLGVDVDQFLQHEELHIPGWYFVQVFLVDFLLFVSLILIFNYRKIGVYLYPLLVSCHFLFHLYYLDTFLYSDVTNLFVFFGGGLFAIIPKWKFFA